MIKSNMRADIVDGLPNKGGDTMSKSKFSVKTIVAIGIGAALFFVMARYLSIPSPIPNTTFGIQYSVAAFMTVLYGPVAGMLIAFIGHMLNDMAAGWGVWWSWVIASGVFGVLMGLGVRGMKLDEGEFGVKDAIRFNVVQIVAHCICWGLVAPVLDILIYNEPVEKIFLQGLVGGLGNILATAIVGTILCFAYAKAKPKKGSLTKEDSTEE